MKENPSSMAVELVLSPRGYFEELVQKAFAQRKITSAPFIENYLVNMLNHYLDARNLYDAKYANESGQRNPQTLAEMYLMAQSAEQSLKMDMLRKLGDRTLYISGFFGDSLKRKVIDIDYYADIGGAAYASLAHHTKEDTLAKVYTTFSNRFPDFVEVLTYVSHHSFIKSDESILRLYERYMRTGSAIARERLEEVGVLSLPLDQVKLGKQG